MPIPLRTSAVRLLALAWLGAALPAAAQVPEDCPNVCDQTYALCIAASCDPETGECGRCDAADGSCGYCYVFDGESCSYGAPCDQVAPSGDTVYSTYSEVLASQYGFRVLTCPSPSHTADCMDGKCTLTGQTVTLTDEKGRKQEVPTAICQCRIATPGGGGTLGGQCDQRNCSAVWSTAGSVLDSQPPCAGAVSAEEECVGAAFCPARPAKEGGGFADCTRATCDWDGKSERMSCSCQVVSDTPSSASKECKEGKEDYLQSRYPGVAGLGVCTSSENYWAFCLDSPCGGADDKGLTTCRCPAVKSTKYDSSQYVIVDGSESACAPGQYRSSATVGQAFAGTQFLRCKQPSEEILDPVIEWVQTP